MCLHPRLRLHLPPWSTVECDLLRETIFECAAVAEAGVGKGGHVDGESSPASIRTWSDLARVYADRVARHNMQTDASITSSEDEVPPRSLRDIRIRVVTMWWEAAHEERRRDSQLLEALAAATVVAKKVDDHE